MTSRIELASVSPAPTDDEAAAIVAALELSWPDAVAAEATTATTPAWRFSGRWWARPVPSRRDRPWF